LVFFLNVYDLLLLQIILLFLFFLLFINFLLFLILNLLKLLFLNLSLLIDIDFLLFLTNDSISHSLLLQLYPIESINLTIHQPLKLPVINSIPIRLQNILIFYNSISILQFTNQHLTILLIILLLFISAHLIIELFNRILNQLLPQCRSTNNSPLIKNINQILSNSVPVMVIP